MCGIVGFAGAIFSPEQLCEMVRLGSNLLDHRGPTEKGIYLDDGIALGAARLAIRDPVKGGQPMTRYGMTIVFNGELYETEVLKQELQAKGYQFESDCDTEVFLLAFVERGLSILLELVGMFAFAIWDSREKKLYLGRDKWGEKPLYYTYDNEFFAFASEIKAFRAFPNIRWDIALRDIGIFLKNSYIPSPSTGWEKIYKLEQGSFLVWNGTDLLKQRYFYPLMTERYHNNTLQGSAEELLNLLSSSVKNCAISDKPVGAFLSGGIDSTTIACLLSHQHPNLPVFSVSWDDPEYCEEHYAREAALALGLQLQSIKCDSTFLKNHLDYLVRLFDEPFADESMIPTYCLAKFAKERVDVVLTGDGSDEFFHGYEKYFFQGSMEDYFDTFSAMNRQVREMICMHDFIKNEKKQDPYLIIEGFAEKKLDMSSPKLKSWVDIGSYLPDDILTKVDRATMAVGLEARAPFLTPKVTNFALNCSFQELIGKEKRGKEILRLAMKSHLPERILNRKKMGFGVPLSRWFRTDLRDWMEERLTQGALLKTHWFSKDGIRKLVDIHLTGRANYSRAIFNLIVLEAWLRCQKTTVA